MRKYSELIKIQDFHKRYEYLSLKGSIGEQTFGMERHLNQTFYKSPEWRRFRNDILIRDNGCDMAHEEYPIQGKIIIHHLNPITPDDILKRSYLLLDPENVVCVSHRTHEAIHYGDISLLPEDYIPRQPNDTIPWR